MFFSLPSWALALLILAVIGGATAAGFALGRYLREHEAKLREPFGVLQGALLGVVGLILAFGLTLAVGRYEDRRAATVAEANAIGTSYLRAQLVADRASGEQVARVVAPIHRPGAPDFARGPGQPRHAPDRGRRGRPPAASLGPRRAGDRRRAARDRPASLRRQPQRDVRCAGDTSRLPDEPCSRRGARARGVRRRGGGRAARLAHLRTRPRTRGDARRGGARHASLARDVRSR